MEEIILLREALKQLDQPFLVVIVGEFNSGKSAVINALLGTRFLADGILPTTNEISLLKFRHGAISKLCPIRLSSCLYLLQTKRLRSSMTFSGGASRNAHFYLTTSVDCPSI